MSSSCSYLDEHWIRLNEQLTHVNSYFTFARALHVSSKVLAVSWTGNHSAKHSKNIILAMGFLPVEAKATSAIIHITTHLESLLDLTKSQGALSKRLQLWEYVVVCWQTHQSLKLLGCVCCPSMQHRSEVDGPTSLCYSGWDCQAIGGVVLRGGPPCLKQTSIECVPYNAALVMSKSCLIGCAFSDPQEYANVFSKRFQNDRYAETSMVIKVDVLGSENC